VRGQHRAVAELAFSPLFHESILEFCAAWCLTATSAAENTAVRSADTSLLISAELDPITPPANAPRGSAFAPPRGATGDPARRTLCSRPEPLRPRDHRALLDAPERAPDASCLAQEPTTSFLVL
jgi:hypothetical protein